MASVGQVLALGQKVALAWAVAVAVAWARRSAVLAGTLGTKALLLQKAKGLGKAALQRQALKVLLHLVAALVRVQALARLTPPLLHLRQPRALAQLPAPLLLLLQLLSPSSQLH